MTIEEKAQAYDEAIERAKEMCTTLSDKAISEYIFPELKVKESEDERIRKWLIGYFNQYIIDGMPQVFGNGLNVKDAIAWLENQGKPFDDNIITRDDEVLQAISIGLTDAKKDLGWSDFGGLPIEEIQEWIEKQGEQKPQGKSALEAINEEKVDNSNKVEPKDYNSIDPLFGKPVDKIEPKFKVGDWITNGATKPAQISSIEDDMYYTHNGTIGGDIESMDKDYHLWTIEDAKDGDVLVHNGCTFIFMGIKDGIVQAIEENMLKLVVPFGEPEYSKDYHPATKEQRDLLFKKVHEAGYEWDEEKKELKKIVDEEQIKKNLQDNSFRRMFEQKSTDKVEPKYKIGDWVIIAAFETEYYHPVGEVIDIKFYCDKTGKVTTSYIIKNLDGKLIDDGIDPNISENQLRLWSIKDAKDGDVLFHSDSASNGIFIFKEILQRGTIQEVVCYCDYDSEDGFLSWGKHTCCWTDSKILHPATKEQRDILMKAMTDAGYTFDFVKKELKKTENKNPLLSDFFKAEYERRKADAQKLAEWSEEDEEHYKACLQYFDVVNPDMVYYKDYQWIKSLKQRIGG